MLTEASNSCILLGLSEALFGSWFLWKVKKNSFSQNIDVHYSAKGFPFDPSRLLISCKFGGLAVNGRYKMCLMYCLKLFEGSFSAHCLYFSGIGDCIKGF